MLPFLRDVDYYDKRMWSQAYSDGARLSFLLPYQGRKYKVFNLKGEVGALEFGTVVHFRIYK